jgi:hypothetical protein
VYYYRSNNAASLKVKTRRERGEGASPSSKAERYSRGCQALVRRRSSLACRSTLEGNRGSLEGGWCGCLIGRGGYWAAAGRGLDINLLSTLLLALVKLYWLEHKNILKTI